MVFNYQFSEELTNDHEVIYVHKTKQLGSAFIIRYNDGGEEFLNTIVLMTEFVSICNHRIETTISEIKSHKLPHKAEIEFDIMRTKKICAICSRTGKEFR